MKVIGLCGQSGSGKSTVSEHFKALGVKVFCADTIYHSLISKRTDCLDLIEKTFGSDVVSNDALDRKKLASVVFGDRKKLDLLNSITHPFVCKEILDSVEKIRNTDEFAVIDAPLLFEAKLDEKCDQVIGVIAPIEKRIERLIIRDGISRSDAENRLKSQLTDDFLRSHCNYIINNDSDIETLYSECDSVMNEIRSKK